MFTITHFAGSRASLVLLAVCCLSTLVAEGDEGMALSCKPARSSDRIECELSNGSGEDIWVLMSPYVLEGPLGASGYRYKYTAGERWENTLEYGFPTLEELGGPIQFKPTVHLINADLHRLTRVSAGDKVEFTISLEGIAGRYLAGSRRWRFRVKAVAARSSAMARLLDGSHLSAECVKGLRSALAATYELSDPVGVATPWTGPQYEVDGCFDRISEQFVHVFAEDFLMPIGVSSR